MSDAIETMAAWIDRQPWPEKVKVEAHSFGDNSSMSRVLWQEWLNNHHNGLTLSDKTQSTQSDWLGDEAITFRKAPNIETGCYISSSWGIYSIERLYDLADGMVPDDKKPDDWDSTGQIIHHSLHGDQDETITTDAGENVSLETAYDIVSEMYDELTDLLPTDLDHSWIWHDGELFYWSDDDIDKMGDL